MFQSMLKVIPTANNDVVNLLVVTPYYLIEQMREKLP